MNLGWVASVPEVIGAFLGSEGSKDFANCGADALDGARGGFTQQVLEFREDCSMGFRSGEYFGRKNNLAPAERMSCRTALPL